MKMVSEFYYSSFSEEKNHIDIMKQNMIIYIAVPEEEQTTRRA